MSLETTLTLKKILCLTGIVGICILWLVNGIIQGISVPDLQKRSNSPGSSLVMGEEADHLHWFIQVTDVHLSIYYDKKRGPDLTHFITKYVDLVKPEAVLVTGDITDAKTANLQGSSQFLEEWKEYDKILRDTKITERTVWLDTRGNHDAFDVPTLTHKQNFFRKYSNMGKKHPRSYHYLHKTSDGDQVSFISVDSCPDPGPKRPFNFFGILQEDNLVELEKLVAEGSSSNTTIFFGHYPSSIIAAPSNGPQLKNILSQHGVYLCGHLHTLANFVPAMYAAHKTGNLELELGDWKDNRRFRVFALDHGLFSFSDHTLGSAWPLVLITNPKDALFTMPLHEPTERIAQSTHIRILIFSPVKIASVSVSIDGTPVSEKLTSQPPLYTLPWKPELYSSGVHTITVTARDSDGKQQIVNQPFSLDNTQLHFDFLPRAILMNNHIAMGKTLFSLMLIACVLPLIVLRICKVKVQVAMSGPLGGCVAKYIQIWIRRIYLLAVNNRLFFPLLVFDLYIAVGPWFIGHFLEDSIGVCFIYGIYVRGAFLPGTLTYMYGFFQLLTFHFPLTLYLGRCCDVAISQHKQHCPRHPLLAWLKNNIVFLVLIAWQMYLSFTGFFKAYGSLALLVCPIRTWSIFLALYLRYVALSKSPSSSPNRPGDNSSTQETSHSTSQLKTDENGYSQ